MSCRGAPLALGLYRAATGLLEPLAPGLLRSRAARGKEDSGRLAERLGRPSLERPEGPLIWLHGVSVGESLSLLPLVEALRARRPEAALLVTSGTRTSADLLARRLPAGVIHQYAPVDAPGAVARFLEHWRPNVGVLAESELWPNLIRQARAHGVRLALVSARMTEASARGWGHAPAAARALLDAFDLIAPQDAATEARLRALGARTGPRLNLKRLGGPLACDAAELAHLREAIGQRRVVLAASTHPGEEALIWEALRRSEAGRAALLVIAPRHPERGATVAAELARAGLAAPRRSMGEPLDPAAPAYVADTLGEMGVWLRLADVVVMGGSFSDGIGGHNPLEAARLARPMVAGPDVANAAELYAELYAEAGAIPALGPDDLARHVEGLLTYPHIARRVGEAAELYAGRQAAALDQALALILPLSQA